MKGTITYRCGHQEEGFIPASEETLAARLAEFARQLCRPCRLAQEQRQFEEAHHSNPVVYNVTDQNGHCLTATRTRPGFCQITVSDMEQAPLEQYEIEIAFVTADLYQRNYRNLHWLEKQYTYKPLD